MAIVKEVVDGNLPYWGKRSWSNTKTSGGFCDCCGSTLTANTLDDVHRGISVGVGVIVPTAEEHVKVIGGASSYYKEVEWHGECVQLPELGVSYSLLIQTGNNEDSSDDEFDEDDLEDEDD